MDISKSSDVFDDEWWELTCELYGVPKDKTKKDYFALCHEKDGSIYTPNTTECITAGIFTRHPPALT